MSAELIGGLVATILTVSILSGTYLYYLDSRKEKKRIIRERQGSGKKRG